MHESIESIKQSAHGVEEALGKIDQAVDEQTKSWSDLVDEARAYNEAQTEAGKAATEAMEDNRLVPLEI